MTLPIIPIPGIGKRRFAGLSKPDCGDNSRTRFSITTFLADVRPREATRCGRRRGSCRPPIRPSLYALMLLMPTSSPKITRIFGFLPAWAVATETAWFGSAKASNPSRPESAGKHDDGHSIQAEPAAWAEGSVRNSNRKCAGVLDFSRIPRDNRHHRQNRIRHVLIHAICKIGETGKCRSVITE